MSLGKAWQGCKTVEMHWTALGISVKLNQDCMSNAGKCQQAVATPQDVRDHMRSHDSTVLGPAA